MAVVPLVTHSVVSSALVRILSSPSSKVNLSVLTEGLTWALDVPRILMSLTVIVPPVIMPTSSFSNAVVKAVATLTSEVMLSPLIVAIALAVSEAV